MGIIFKYKSPKRNCNDCSGTGIDPLGKICTRCISPARYTKEYSKQLTVIKKYQFRSGNYWEEKVSFAAKRLKSAIPTWSSNRKGKTMANLDRDELKRIMTECLHEVGPKKWINKSSVIFNMKAKFGDIFDEDSAREIYDEIYGKYMEDNCG